MAVTLINIFKVPAGRAQWDSSEAFIQAHKDYVPGKESIASIEFHPALFEEIIMNRNLLRARSAGDE